MTAAAILFVLFAIVALVAPDKNKVARLLSAIVLLAISALFAFSR